MRTVAFVQPHLDDIALSCGGLVAQRVAAGHRVVVISLFTRTRHRTSERRRAAEDAAACRVAGAERLDLGFDDAPDRAQLALTFTALMLDAVVEPALVRDVKAALRTQLAALGATEVWYPLAIGQHIDHRTAFAARVAPRGARLRFYVDRPYAFVPAFVELRRRELAGSTRPRHIAPAEVLAQIDRHHCGGFLVGSEREHVGRTISERLATPRRGQGLAVRFRRHPIADRATARAMLACYASELTRLFGAWSWQRAWPAFELEGQLADRVR